MIVKNLKFTYNLSTLIELCKQKLLILFSDHQYNIRYKKPNVCILYLPNIVFGHKYIYIIHKVKFML